MLYVQSGACYSTFVYDVAFSIDLDMAERRMTSLTQRQTIKHKRRAPRYFEYRPAPLRIIQERGPSIEVKDLTLSTQVEVVVYDFGAVGITYRLPLGAGVSDLLALSHALYENEHLLADSRRRVEELLKVIQSAVLKSRISSFVEDYVIFHVEEFNPPVSIPDLTTRHGSSVANILRAESIDLSDDEVKDALSHRISFGKEDIVIIDWNAALVIDRDPADVLAVLEFANVELLEMRFLDQRLDEALTLAYERLSKRAHTWRRLFGSHPAHLREISQWQVDSAILFEGVNNVLKLLGDQYLARLYRLTAQRFHLADWDTSIIRKLQTLESIYQKISDQLVSRRMEVLEWIIILLIAISIVLPFFIGVAEH